MEEEDQVWQFLTRLGACEPSIEWARQFHADFRSAWEACPNGQWLYWLLCEIGRVSVVPLHAIDACGYLVSDAWTTYRSEARWLRVRNHDGYVGGESALAVERDAALERAARMYADDIREAVPWHQVCQWIKEY